MLLAYLYYGVGLLQAETSAGTSLGGLVITSNIKWEPFQFWFLYGVRITQGPRIITVAHMWTLKKKIARELSRGAACT